MTTLRMQRRGYWEKLSNETMRNLYLVSIVNRKYAFINYLKTLSTCWLVVSTKRNKTFPPLLRTG